MSPQGRLHWIRMGFDDFVPKPFRFERICECLANLLYVEYEYTSSMPTDREETEAIALPTVPLPEALRSRLVEAAELYDLTTLNQCFNELDALWAS